MDIKVKKKPYQCELIVKDDSTGRRKTANIDFIDTPLITEWRTKRYSVSTNVA